MMCWLSWALPGRYLSYSTGLAETNGSAMMLLKSLAGCMILTWRVSVFGADSPAMVWLFCQAATEAAVADGAPLALK